MKICSVCKRCFDDTADHCVDAGHPPLSVSCTGDPLMVPGYSLERMAVSAAKVDTYRARRLDCGRNCRVRIISVDAQNREDLLRDAQIAAMVFDARAAEIYEAGTLPTGEYFVVEEDVEGQTTLRKHLAGSGVPELLTSIRIVEQIAETLHVLHARGLTHGAVRPENIVVHYGPDGLPKIKLCGIDLGGVIARNTIANKFLIDSAIGAIRYCAPEQCSGLPLSPQTDVYSLGVVFYELLAGVPPFNAQKATVLIEMHRSHRPPEIRIEDFELRMLVTHSLSESLQKQPSFRQSSADLFARQMRHIEQLATHVSTPPPAVGSSAPPPRITPTPVVFNTAPVSRPIAETKAIEDYPRSYEGLAEPIPAYEPDPASGPVEAGAYATAEESFPTPEVEFQAEPEPQSVSAVLTAAEENLPPAGPEATIEFQLPERSSLAERRHRLKLWMKQTHPQRSLGPEVNDDALPTIACELVEEPPAVPVIAAADPEPIGEVQPETALKPKLIVWDQPDDIPSIEEIEAEALLEFEHAPGDASAANAAIVQQEPHVALAAPPRLIEWELPEDDIPSLEDVIEVRMSEEAAVDPATQFKPEVFDVAAALQSMIEADLKPADQGPLAVAKNNEAHAAEMPRFEFVPTLLDCARQRPKPEPRRDHTSIFTSYEPADTPPRAFPYRSMFIGLGLMLIAAIVGLGGDPLWRYFSEPEPGSPIATAAAPAPVGPLPARSDRSTHEELPASESEPPNSFTNSEPVDETPQQTTPKRSNTAAAAGPKVKQPVQTAAPASDPPERAAATPFAPSTVVITYGSGNVRRSDTQKERPASNAPGTDVENSSGATRPRIVQSPPNR